MTAQELHNSIVEQARKEGFLMLYSQIRQDGKVVSDYQYGEGRARLNAYSVSKSVVAAGVGIAIGEGLLSLDDKVADYFKEYLPENPSEYMLNSTVRDFLMMSSGLKDALFFSENTERYEEKDWISYFWRQEFDHPAGETYLYSNMNSYILSCLVEKVSGETLLEYLRYRMFEPIGIKNPDWTYCPKGHTYGCNGLYLNIDEMGYLGELFLNKGSFNGRQIIPGDFMEEATVSHIDTTNNTYSPRYNFGYGYYFWMTEIPGVYLSYGNYGEWLVMVPEKNMVLCFLSFEPVNHLRIIEIIMDKLKEYMGI